MLYVGAHSCASHMSNVLAHICASHICAMCLHIYMCFAHMGNVCAPIWKIHEGQQATVGQESAGA